MDIEADLAVTVLPLRGCVDRFDAPATVYGWVDTSSHPGRGRGITVRISHDDKIIATGALSFPRPDIVPDMDYLSGFGITCDVDIPDDVFAFGRLLVEVVDERGNVTVLPHYDLPRSFALERYLLVTPPFGKFSAAVLLNRLLHSRDIPKEARRALRDLNDQYFEEADRNLLYKFESLGCDCSLGSVQRAYGAEPLGLFRFTGISIDGVIAALDSQFAGIGQPEFTKIVTAENGEYYTSDTRYYMMSHTHVFEGKVKLEEFYEKQCRKISFLVRNMIEKLESDDVIFVVHHLPREIPNKLLRQLLEAMRRYGPAPLLYLQLADEEHPPGTVAMRDDGIMVGYVLRVQGEIMRPVWEVREGWIRTFRAARALFAAHAPGLA